MTAERLQKVLASAGVASRRDCEDLIGAGRVAVNGKVVVVPGTRVDAEHDEITVDGQPIGKINPRTYVMLHKPTGVVSTADDPQGRPTVVEQVGLPTRLFPIGRLDYDSEGLLLLTDDGELTQRLTHPSYQVEKEYRALLDQPPVADALREWRNGVMLDDALTAPAWVEVLERTDEGAWVRVVLHEGRKRQIREVAKLLGYEVLRLIRVREGPIVLGDLPAGQWRKLTDDEVESLWSHVGGHGAEPPAAVERAEAPARARRRTSNPAPDARREREISGDGPPPAEQSNRAPRRDDRGEFDARGPRRDDRGGFDARGPRRDDRGEFDARGPRRDDRGEFDARGPRRDDRGGFDARGPRRDDRGGFDARGPRRDDRGGFDARGPRRDDRGGFDARGPRRDDRGGFDARGPRRDDRGGFDARGPRRDDRGGFDARGPRRDDRGGFDARGPRRDDRGGFDARGPRRDDRGGFDARGPRRDDRGGFDARGPRRDDRGGFDARGPRRDDRGGFDARGPRRDDRGGFDARGPRRDDRGGFDARGPRRDDTDGDQHQDFNSARPERGNERPPDRPVREEKRGPGREWHERTIAEKRAAAQRSAPRGGRYGGRGTAPRRNGFPFRARPLREDEKE